MRDVTQAATVIHTANHNVCTKSRLDIFLGCEFRLNLMSAHFPAISQPTHCVLWFLSQYRALCTLKNRTGKQTLLNVTPRLQVHGNPDRLKTVLLLQLPQLKRDEEGRYK